MKLSFGPELHKKEVFKKVEAYLRELSISFSSVDVKRPWGGFFVIDENDTDKFILRYFPDYDKELIRQFGSKLSPKILLVAPGQKLSWQYHNRRAELWRSISGPTGYIRSSSDRQMDLQILYKGDTVQFEPTERHRLVGLRTWGVVAEIWQHTDSKHPSNELDIFRIEDAYGR